MDDSLLDATQRLRDSAWQALQGNREFVAFKALDDAVVAMGGRRAAQSMIDTDHLVAAISAHIGAPKLSQANAAAALLAEAGRPLHISEIVVGLRARGVTASGDNPEINVSSTLSRDSRFESMKIAGRSVWWFKDQPIPDNARGAVLMSGLLSRIADYAQKGGDGDAPPTT